MEMLIYRKVNGISWKEKTINYEDPGEAGNENKADGKNKNKTREIFRPQ